MGVKKINVRQFSVFCEAVAKESNRSGKETIEIFKIKAVTGIEIQAAGPIVPHINIQFLL
ncbi:MAG: hypothetical protein A2176_05705 [Spirochaetes bacterium RBG_13_51_14]|nr:MAG: hypothetical protein A2176_05705 [Spirochaetes bacterium RBG_13_51_14]